MAPSLMFLGSPASIALLLLAIFQGPVVGAITFTFANRCPDMVWPGLLSGYGSPPLETIGFALSPGQSRSLYGPTGWSDRFWGRSGSGCDFDGRGKGTCATGECGSGEVKCRGARATPPATLAEFTLLYLQLELAVEPEGHIRYRPVMTPTELNRPSLHRLSRPRASRGATGTSSMAPLRAASACPGRRRRKSRRCLPCTSRDFGE